MNGKLGERTVRPAPPDRAEQRPVVEFRLDPHGPSKRPEQLAELVESALRREFPAAAELSHLQA